MADNEATATGPKPFKAKRGLIAPPGAKGSYGTTYKIDYIPPPLGQYTGVSPNLGLKARVEGTAGKPGELGLGPDAQTQYKTTFKPHGDAYKNKQPYEDRARETHLRPRTGAKVDYTTSYKVWGNGPRLPEGAEPQTMKPGQSKAPTNYSLGDDMTTMYHEHYPPKEGDGFAVRVTKQTVEGDGRHEMEPYGPLCKSLAHESYQAPPQESYLVLKDKAKMRVDPVGTVPPDRDYGLGRYGDTEYHDQYVPKKIGSVTLRKVD